MAKTAPFEKHTERYEQWFVHHAAAYVSELLAVRVLLPARGVGLEIGVGSGRFAAPLGVGIGIDPSLHMLERAKGRGISVACGVAEALPFRSGAFDYALIVTTICFVDDPIAMLKEARRVLKPRGRLVIGFIDRDSQLGQHYLTHQAESVFYREAKFFSAQEIDRMLAESGFGRRSWMQTLSKPPDQTTDVEAVQPGIGQGAFVAVRAARLP
jgi:SAM-dependent methyltransferase